MNGGCSCGGNPRSQRFINSSVDIRVAGTGCVERILVGVGNIKGLKSVGEAVRALQNLCNVVQIVMTSCRQGAKHVVIC